MFDESASLVEEERLGAVSAGRTLDDAVREKPGAHVRATDFAAGVVARPAS